MADLFNAMGMGQSSDQFLLQNLLGLLTGQPQNVGGAGTTGSDPYTSGITSLLQNLLGQMGGQAGPSPISYGGDAAMPAYTQVGGGLKLPTGGGNPALSQLLMQLAGGMQGGQSGGAVAPTIGQAGPNWNNIFQPSPYTITGSNPYSTPQGGDTLGTPLTMGPGGTFATPPPGPGDPYGAPAGTTMPASPQMFGPADLAALYQQIDPGKPRDAARITSTLGAGPWTYDQLSGSGTNMGGLSGRSQGDWQSVLADLNAAIAGGQQPTTGGASPTGAPTQPGSLSATDISNYYYPTGPMEQAMQNWFAQGPAGMMAPTGPAQNLLEQLFQQGPGAFTLAPGAAENQLLGMFGQGPGAFTAGAGPVESMLGGMLAGGPGAFTPAPGAIESMLGGIIGKGPGGLTPPASQGESDLLSLEHAPFLESVAQGKVPPGIMAQFQDQMARNNAQVMESMGTAGQRFGTGFADTLSRTQNEATNTLMANTEHDAMTALGLQSAMAQGAGSLANQRATAALSAYTSLVNSGVNAETAREVAGLNAFSDIGRSIAGNETSRGIAGMNLFGNMGEALMGSADQRGLAGLNLFGNVGQGLMNTESTMSNDAMNRLFGLGNTLTGLETGREQGGQSMQWQDFLRSSGLPPELAGLISLLNPQGAGTSTQSTSGGGSQLGSLAALLPFLLNP